MKIGDWKASAELNKIYCEARALGLETNLAELEAFGFTVVEPDKVKADGLCERMLKSVQAICAQLDADGAPINLPLGSKSDYARMVHGLIGRDPLFAEAVMHPVALTLGRYLMGASCRLFAVSAFVKRGPATSTHLHTDTLGTPPPLYPFGITCNISWILTDYSTDKGTFAMVPGSHRYCRHPSDIEQPKIMGGPNENICVPVEARPGSLVVFNGNTWHGTWPKSDDGFRAHIVNGYCRNYIIPGESYDDASPELIEKYGADIAHLFARDTWQTYKTPQAVPDLVALRRAHVTPSA
jgi:hypothetical protein